MQVGFLLFYPEAKAPGYLEIDQKKKSHDGMRTNLARFRDGLPIQAYRH
jgi:hypothetical protein